MKCPALTTILAFEVRPDNFPITCRGRWREGLVLKQVRVSLGVILIPRPKINMICHQVNDASRLEYTVHMSHRFILHDATFVVSRLGPGISEIQMQHIDDASGALMLQELTTIVVK